MRQLFFRGALGALFLVCIGVALQADKADAWKPYTHNFTGDNAYNDAVDDGMVTINGHEYPVNPRLVLALQTHKAHYNAGVVGPDGFPDLVMGQSVIHPGNPETYPANPEGTGEWLRHVLDNAWDAQTDPRYSEDEKLGILAFGYGYLTHAAGDMWAHTLVNDFAGGIFPSVSEIVADPMAAKIALKHIIVEGYMGDATPGYDSNPDRTHVPGEVNESGQPQVSDNATPGIDFAAPPDLFIWETFVGRGDDGTGALTQPLPGMPTANHGLLVDFFYTLRNDLNAEAGTNSNIQQAIDDFNELQDAIDYVIAECSFPPDPIECPIALANLGFESIEAVIQASGDLLQAAAEEVVDAYLRAWVDDIDYGLQHWSSVGLAFTNWVTDAQSFREFQDEQCFDAGTGAEDDAARAACEDAVGTVGYLLDLIGESLTTADPHLLSMLGVPDAVSGLIEFADEVFDAIDEFINIPNPISAAITEMKEWLKDEVVGAVSDVLGFDVQLYSDLMRNPSAYLDPIDQPPLPAPFENIQLFAEGEHERLDAIIGLPVDHHREDRGLEDEIQFIIDEFNPLENTITTAKLLLLGGSQLNNVLADGVGRPVATYPTGDRTNVMITPLGGGESWLRSIDSDHQWRQDGLPITCNPGGYCPNGATEREAKFNGGTGRMPIWESCVLRPAFSVLFDDWQNGGEDFPALGDGVSPDSASDPSAPISKLSQTQGASYDNGVRKFVGGDNVFTVSATDTPSNLAFPADELELRYRITGPNGVAGQWVSAEQGDTFSIAGDDGKYVIEVQSGDPCHTLAEGDGLDAGAPVAFEYWLDTTPPALTCATPPYNQDWITDQYATADWTLDDGPDGSGVDATKTSAEVDGYVTPDGTANVSVGYVYDMYMFYPGTRTTQVFAQDNIGNSAMNPCEFYLYATPESLINNLNRAQSESDVSIADVYDGLMDKLLQVQRQHAKGKHPTEWNALDAYIEQLEGQRDQGIDLLVANRFIAYAQERIDLQR